MTRQWKSSSNRGDINALQRLRLLLYFRDQGWQFVTQMSEFRVTEFDIRRIVQKEISLHEEFEHQPTNFAQQELQASCLKDELADMKRKYWFLEREWGLRRGAFHKGPVSRAFILWRSHPQWYMHRTLRDHCAREGGCCGRDCGCYAHRNVGSRSLGARHCTDECGCCRKARGFDFTPDEKTALKARLEDRSRDTCDVYFQELMQVSIWGLLDDNNENPFDLIETHHGTGRIDDRDDSVTLVDVTDI